MTSPTFPKLTAVGGFRLWVQNNPSLTRLDLPVLTTVQGALVVAGNALADLSLPALTTVAGNLQVEYEAALTTFSLPALSGLGGDFLAISRNPALPQCLAAAFKDHMVSDLGFSGIWSIVGNDEAATCP